MAEELKPCPFCGGEAKLFLDIICAGHGDSAHKYYAICKSCGAAGPYFYPRFVGTEVDCEKVAADAWNRRSPEIVKVETSFYDQEETYPDCTVQVLTNTATGEISVGWWRNE